MKHLRFVTLLLAGLMLLPLAACAKPVTEAGSVVIDIPVDTPAPTGAPANPGSVPTAPIPEETPAAATPLPGEAAVPEETPASTPAPAETPKPTEAPAATEAPAQTPAPEAEGDASVPSGDLPYYLYVEKGSFTLTIYERASDGTYSKVYKTYRIAHGGNKTPAGTFTLGGDRERWHEFPDGGFVQFATRYHKRLYIHSPLYGEENNGYMWPKYYDGELGIGKESTGGCLRMVTEAARFIYENCPEGTVMEIVNGAPRGTTSDEVPSRNGERFDPTDVEANR